MNVPTEDAGWVPFTGAPAPPRDASPPAAPAHARDRCSVELTGRLTNAPSGGTTRAGSPVTSFLLTVSAQPGALVPLFSVRAFDHVALAAAHLAAGAQVTVRGTLSIRQTERGDLRLSVRAERITSNT